MADVQEPAPAPAPEGVKVFVGNLSFQVGKEELEKEFADAGNVLSANIIMRGSRSRGYGFVEMATDDEADKALELLNHREIDGRPVNVELAKPREENPAQGEQAPRKGRGRGGRGRGRGRGRRGRGRGGARGRGEGEEGVEGAEAPADEAAPAADEAPVDSIEGEAAEGEGSDRPRKARQGRRGRGRGGRGRGGRGRGRAGGRSDELREPSTDTLFVANLPFATDDEELKGFFGEYNPAKAYVVVGRNGRSKGFGFVTFDNNEDQQNALKLDGVSLLERAIAVRVALNPEPHPEKAEEEEEEGEAPAAVEEKAEEPEQAAE